MECSSKECPGKNDCCDARLGGSEAAVVCLSGKLVEVVVITLTIIPRTIPVT